MRFNAGILQDALMVNGVGKMINCSSCNRKTIRKKTLIGRHKYGWYCQDCMIYTFPNEKQDR
jgi:transposase-like protein